MKKYPTFNEWRTAIVEEIEKNSSFKGYEIKRNDYITKILLYTFNSAKHNTEFEIYKIDKINKINSIIIPQHDSLTISPLRELLNLNEKENEEEKNEAEKQGLDENKNLIEKDVKMESEEEEEEAEIINEDEENENESEAINEHNLVDEMTGKNIDNVDNFRFNMMHLLNDNQYKDLEDEIDKLLIENKKKKLERIKVNNINLKINYIISINNIKFKLNLPNNYDS